MTKGMKIIEVIVVVLCVSLVMVWMTTYLLNYGTTRTENVVLGNYYLVKTGKEKNAEILADLKEQQVEILANDYSNGVWYILYKDIE